MKKKWLLGVLTIGLLSTSVPANVFAEPTEDADDFVTTDVLPVGDTDALREPIAYTEDGEPIYGGYIETSEDSNAPLLEDEGLENAVLTDTAVPAVYNPKTQNCGYTLPQIRNQNPYGTCWAFGSIAPMEFSLMKQHNVTKDLSELQLAYFTYHGGTDPLGGTNGDSVTYLSSASDDYLDFGGNLSYSTIALMNWRGAVDETTVPYSQAKSTLTNGLASSYEYSKDSAHLQNFYKINLSDSQAVKKAIMTYGAVGESYYHSSSYYNSSKNAYYNYNSTSTNHAVTIVGWDDTFSKSNFKKQPKSDGAWLIRNSWGSDNMSIYGYFWISYEDTSLRDTVYVFDAEPASNYDHNYQYDGSITSGTFSKSNSITAANVFTTKANEWEELKAVSFSVPNQAQVGYTVKIYTNLTDASNPESGTLVSSATTTGTTSYAGSYTVKLKNSVKLKKGDTFAAVVELTKSGSSVGLGVESSQTLWSSIRCVASANAGQSFYKSGNSWIDYGKANNRNIRIKAYTSNTTAPSCQVTFDANGGSVNSGAKTVTPGAAYGSLPTPTRTNKIFDGWYTAAQGGERVTAETKVTLTSNHTLYAHWKDITVTVTFDANGGAVGQSTKNVTAGAQYGDLPTPTRDGMNFTGWYTEANGGSKIEASTNVSVTSNQTLYAHWEANPVDISGQGTGIFIMSLDGNGIFAGMTTTSLTDKADTEYRWLYYQDGNWKTVQDWQTGNEWLSWKPEKSGDYVIVAQARSVSDHARTEQASTGFTYHPQIKGKCQMPYTGEGGGYLIGMESYNNQGYTYEMLILDCTLLAEGKDAWTYTTGRCGAEGNAFWTVWQPQYGYYWTLFRVYDGNGNIIDEDCYGFENI